LLTSPVNRSARNDTLSATTPQRLGLAVIAALSFIASLVIYRTLFPLFSADLDEGVYAFHGEMLRSGMMTLPVETHGEFFRPWLSGSDEGRIFTQYQPGLPAFLAVTGALGSYRVGLALLAPVLTYATYGLARELFRQPRIAVGAAAATSLSPIFLVHSALVLTYVPTTAAVTAGSWLWLVAVRRGHAWIALTAGIAIGLAALARPLDAVLFVAPFGLLGLHRARSGDRRALLTAAVAGAGAFVAVLLAYNAAITGGALRFPNTAADPLNNFGFGTRRILPTEPTTDYTFGDAIRALVDNARGVPSWILGGPLALVAVGVGICAGRRQHRPELVALVTATVLFPFAYLFFWATKLSAGGATNGIGPHYYVPAFVPLIITAALGASLIRWTKPTAGLAVALAVAVTGWSLPDKINSSRSVTEGFEEVDALIPDDISQAIVLVDTEGKPYILSRWPFLAPDPDLTGNILYAAEYSPRAPLLLEQFGDRTFYRLRREGRPGDADVFRPSGGFTELSGTRGRQLQFTVTVTDDNRLLDDRTVGSTYVRVGDDIVLTSNARINEFVLSGRLGTGEELLTESTMLVVGVSLITPGGAVAHAEQRIAVALAPNGHLVTLTPGAGFYEIVFPDQRAWFPFDVSGLVQVEVTPL